MNIRFFLGLSAILAASCGGGSSTVTLDGILQAVQQGINVPTDPVPTVSILGRNADEFEMAVSTATASSQVQFTLKGVPADQDLVFRVSGSAIESVLSFPINASEDGSHRVPVLIGNSISTFIAMAENPSGINIDVDENLGIVAGILQPPFSDSVVSTGANTDRVRMVQKNTNTEITYDGPYYFNSQGDLVDSGSCPDQECNYIFFNVPEGSFRFQKLDSGSNVLAQNDVVVLASQLTFGME
ncbi:MAG: hypothetical protein KDD46_01320 [Bdellovibrionales bacterium]|nr:hypothetical protein [Bdellovibrionales bacterium]